MGKSLEVLMPEHLKAEKELEKISAVAQAEGFLRSYQTQRVTKDGETIDVLFTRTAIRDGQGQLIGYSSVLKNITEQKLLDRHLTQWRSFRPSVSWRRDWRMKSRTRWPA